MHLQNPYHGEASSYLIIKLILLQVVACSFVYGAKFKNKQVAGLRSNDGSENDHRDNLVSPSSAPSAQTYNPSAIGVWPGSRSVDVRNPHTGIDLTRG